jgi:hypothetical protein
MVRLNAGFVQSSDISLIVENDDCFELSVSHTPFLDQLIVYCQNGQIQLSELVEEVKIFSIQGALLQQEAQSQVIQFNDAPGCYILQWRMNGKIGVQKIMIN